MRKVMLVLAAVALLITGVVAPANAGPAARPFSGNVHGMVSFVPVGPVVCPPTDLFLGVLQTRSKATGTATHLGRTTFETQHCTPLGDQITGGTETLTAANGDQIFVTYSGNAPFNLGTSVPGVTVIDMSGPFTIVGGTGRFDGASGSGTMNATVLFEGLDVQYWPGTWSWTGAITY